jgi:hypothetical protein
LSALEEIDFFFSFLTFFCMGTCALVLFAF